MIINFFCVKFDRLEKSFSSNNFLFDSRYDQQFRLDAERGDCGLFDCSSVNSASIQLKKIVVRISSSHLVVSEGRVAGAIENIGVEFSGIFYDKILRAG